MVSSVSRRANLANRGRVEGQSQSFLVTDSKELLFDPAFMNLEMDALLRRLVETDRTKWTALEELRGYRGGKRR